MNLTKIKLSFESKFIKLLVRDKQGNLTHTVWEKP